ncbi:hypothetical protein LCGC14_1234790 [marine sediment metagenome]|uniref:Uncharacterized protein n=1 Tax=marine sediment metagenome TaxID=412755 RepID=A0A0F9PBR2_9ZZZZ
MTPREFDALVAARKQITFRHDLRTGLIACVFANAYRRKGRPAFKPTDFVPGYTKKRMSAEQMRDKIFVLHEHFVKRADQVEKEEKHG